MENKDWRGVIDQCPYRTETGETCGERTPWESGIGYDWCGAYAEGKPYECPLRRWKWSEERKKIVPTQNSDLP